MSTKNHLLLPTFASTAEPWACSADCSRLQGRLNGATGRKPETTPLSLHMNGSVARIQIHQPIVHRTRPGLEVAGFISIEAIARAFRTAVSDKAVQRVILDVDSPGGEVAGVLDLSDEIASSPKPVVAFCEQAEGSSYLLAAACRRIIGSRTARVGGIGCSVVHVDVSTAERNAGVSPREVTSGTAKSHGSPHRPLDPASERALQKQVDTVAAEMFSSVSRHRKNLTVATIKAFEGGSFLGRHAVQLGLLDELGTLNTAMRPAPSKATTKPGKAPARPVPAKVGASIPRGKAAVLARLAELGAAATTHMKVAPRVTPSKVTTTVKPAATVKPSAPPRPAWPARLEPGTPETVIARAWSELAPLRAEFGNYVQFRALVRRWGCNLPTSR